MTTKKTQDVAMFYKNDMPGGIGIMVRNIPVEMLSRLRQSRDEGYRKAVADGEREEFIAAAVAELESLGRRGDDQKQEDWPVAFAAIYTLVTQKVIADDEYNGFIYLKIMSVK